jgi:hypothetical protein
MCSLSNLTQDVVLRFYVHSSNPNENRIGNIQVRHLLESPIDFHYALVGKLHDLLSILLRPSTCLRNSTTGFYHSCSNPFFDSMEKEFLS